VAPAAVTLDPEVAPAAVTLDPEVAPAAEALDPDDAFRAELLQLVYGEEVLPNALLECLNNGFKAMAHTVPEGSASEYAASPQAYAQRVREQLVKTAKALLLVVSEHPTYTRMFTFKKHIDGLLTLCLLKALGCAGNSFASRRSSRGRRTPNAYASWPGSCGGRRFSST